jgi:threonine/homoserine efflux transporter RhtA
MLAPFTGASVVHAAGLDTISEPNMSYTPSRPMGYGCLILSMSLVGAYVALTKPLAALLPVFLLAWLRFGIGAVAMLRWLKKPADEKPLSTQSRWLVFLESFLGNFLFTLCMITGVSMTNAVSAGVIMSSIPAVVAVMSWVFLKEKSACASGARWPAAPSASACCRWPRTAMARPPPPAGRAPGWATCWCSAPYCARRPMPSSARS